MIKPEPEPNQTKPTKALNHLFDAFGFKQHPDKTFIGRVTKAFDWLGYQYNENGIIDIAPRAKAHKSAQITQLYEQARRLHQADSVVQQRVVNYAKRWQQWCYSGLQGITLPAVPLLAQGLR